MEIYTILYCLRTEDIETEEVIGVCQTEEDAIEFMDDDIETTKHRFKIEQDPQRISKTSVWLESPSGKARISWKIQRFQGRSVEK